MLNQSSKAIIFDPFSPLDAGSYRCEAHDDSDHVIFCGQIQLKVGELLLDQSSEIVYYIVQKFHGGNFDEFDKWPVVCHNFSF